MIINIDLWKKLQEAVTVDLKIDTQFILIHIGKL
jgi:hypothetical protein